MNRIHIGLSVQNLEQSVAYYSALFGEEPVVLESDYAKWTPQDPAVNLSVTTRSAGQTGSVHFGIDVQEKEDIGEVTDRLQDKGFGITDEGETICCYHRSTKTWANDPDGHAWEIFLTTAREKEFGRSALAGVIPESADVVCCDDDCCGGEDAA